MTQRQSTDEVERPVETPERDAESGAPRCARCASGQLAHHDDADGFAFCRSPRAAFSVVLPAYNEETVIADTVARCVEVLSALAPDYEVIIVDDGSRDRTGQVADELAATNPHVPTVAS